MDVQEQLTRHAGEIGELKGKLDALATKDFVRKENAALLKELSDKIDNQTRDIQDEISQNREFRQRMTTIGAIIAVVLSILVALLNAIVGAVGIGLIQF